MPIYVYRCTQCSLEKEFLQKISDEPLSNECPACGQKTFIKKITAAGFQLKGTGWYETDFKNSSKPKAENASTTPSPASTKSENSSSVN